jgi:hypothetical protein
VFACNMWVKSFFLGVVQPTLVDIHYYYPSVSCHHTHHQSSSLLHPLLRELPMGVLKVRCMDGHCVSLNKRLALVWSPVLKEKYGWLKFANLNSFLRACSLLVRALLPVVRLFACSSACVAALLTAVEQRSLPLRLDTVDSDTLKRVFEYCAYHDMATEKHTPQLREFDRSFVHRSPLNLCALASVC